MFDAKTGRFDRRNLYYHLDLSAVRNLRRVVEITRLCLDLCYQYNILSINVCILLIIS